MKILVDTSVWIDHLRRPVPALLEHLNDNNVLAHPIVIGELACGTLPDRTTFLRNMDAMPEIREGTHQEVRGFIESAKLIGRGVGLMDAHLLYSVLHEEGALLWTRDERLNRIAEELSVSYFEAP